jgi:hypothetical protein
LVRAEAGQYDRALALAEEVGARGQQNGFDEWVMVSASEGAVVRAMASLASEATDSTTLEAHIQILTAVVDGWRAAGLISFLGWYDAALARVLIAAGKNDVARERVDLALQMADDTEWHFYDAELLRLRAHTCDAPDARHAALRAAIKLARTQGAFVLELRAAADDFELVGEPARGALSDALSRFPSEQSWPELAHARAQLQ